MGDDGLSPPAAGGPNGAHLNGRSSGVSPDRFAGNGNSAAPPGHSFRRAATVSSAGGGDAFSSAFAAAAPAPFPPPRRRSSNFSDYSLQEARRSLQSSTDDILNPSSGASGLRFAHGGHDHDASSGWASLPLVFALLPAVGGLFFNNGSAVITDVMLLGLAAIFLHWSVTQPWIWYHSAQEVRVQQERDSDPLDDDTEAESVGDPTHGQRAQSPLGGSTAKPTTLADVPEVPEDGEAPPQVTKPTNESPTLAREQATRELYKHEVMALIACFAFPMLAAYLLHAIRGQLSRPSEGLVSDYNLTIFLLASEIRPLSHMIKLVQSRTLHLQRIVHEHPLRGEAGTTSTRMAGLLARIEDLEHSSRRAAEDTTPGDIVGDGKANGGPAAAAARQDADALVREVRGAIQPELDALNRAVRRYEKKATVLAFQTEARLGAVDARLGDAVALAAAAAKNSNAAAASSSLSASSSAAAGWLLALLGWLVDRAVYWLLAVPAQAVLAVVTLPLRGLLSLLGRRGSRRRTGTAGGPGQERGGQRQAGGRVGVGAGGKGVGGAQARLGPSSDRAGVRVSKR